MDKVLETHFRIAQPVTAHRPDNVPDATIPLQPPEFDTPGSVMEAIQTRRREHGFASTPLSLPELNNVLWAANGINFPSQDKRITLSPLATGQIELYALVFGGIYRYDPNRHLLTLVNAVNLRNTTEHLELTSQAPLTLIYVATLIEKEAVPEDRREISAGVRVGEIAQNLHLYCSSIGLVSATRTAVDRRAAARELELTDNVVPLMLQMVGHPNEP